MLLTLCILAPLFFCYQSSLSTLAPLLSIISFCEHYSGKVFACQHQILVADSRNTKVDVRTCRTLFTTLEGILWLSPTIHKILHAGTHECLLILRYLIHSQVSHTYSPYLEAKYSQHISFKIR